MKLTVLVENTACGEVRSAHGLSLYIETEKHKILFDSGPYGDLLLKNADALGIGLSEVDTAILSHGHYDHAGGFCDFLRVNSHAKLYINRRAILGHYKADMRYIGIDPILCRDYADRMVLTDGVYAIDDGLVLFNDVKTADLVSDASTHFLEDGDEIPVQDEFLHEQDLIIRENGKTALIAGCAHRGIVNIVRRAAELCGKVPDAVFAGFHLTNPSAKKDEPDELIRAVGDKLKAIGGKYYTGHCTGEGPYGILSETLGDRIEYLGGGKTFIV